MDCAEAQRNFSSYLDDALTTEARACVDAHLDVCPFCRLRLDETRAVVRRLALVSPPALPASLSAQIINAIAIERAAQTARAQAPQAILISWLRPRLMPYTIGAFASLLLFFIVASALRPHMRTLRDLAAAAREEPVSPNDVIWFHPARMAHSPEEYAANRGGFSNESPSLDPNGALAALISTSASNRHHHRFDDDDMVFVADVDAQGGARLAEVIQPPRDKQMLRELQKALRQTPAFVPAATDGRPEMMRVVFVMEKVKVEDKAY
jgi:hypothetical protein